MRTSPLPACFDLIRQDFDIVLDFLGVEFAADQPFDAENRIFGVGDGLAFGNLAHQALTAVVDSNNRRGGAPAFGIGDDVGIPALHDGHTGVGGAEINSDDFAHVDDPP